MNPFLQSALLILSLLLLPLTLQANTERLQPVETLSEANEVLDDAHLAYERGDTREAMDAYLRVANSPFGGAPAWFNAGTAAYRSGDVGRAVLYYKRALKIDPGYTRARSSLDFVSPATNQQEVGFAEEVLGTVFNRTSPGLWVLVAQGFFLLMCFALARSIAARHRDDRGHWIAVFSWCGVFLLISGGIAWANHLYRVSGAEAVVLAEKAITRTEPRPDATAQLELPPGTVLELTESPRRGFVRFRLVDGRAGFISTDQIERI